MYALLLLCQLPPLPPPVKLLVTSDDFASSRASDALTERLHSNQPPTAEALAPASEVTTHAGVSFAPTIGEQMLSASNALGVHRRESAALTAAAQEYANYLAATRQQGHYANGSPEQRAARAGFRGTLLTPGKLHPDGWTSYGVGEVLCFGGRSVSDAFDGWMQSEGHKAAVLEPSYDCAGFGQCGTVWVGLYGNSKPITAAPITGMRPGGGPNAATTQQKPCAIMPQTYQRRGLFGRR